MKYWFDTEFIEDGKTIDLISIGIVSEDGRVMYEESNEFDVDKASEWVMDNVVRHLGNHDLRISKKAIRDKVTCFVGYDDKPEFWAYYGAYDWVAFCQLFGTMMELPKGYPFYCRDVKQLCDSLGNPQLPKQDTLEHNALNDAVWTREAYNWLLDNQINT